MIVYLMKVGDELVEYMNKLADNNEKFETKDLFTLYGIDVVASTGFGFEANCIKNPNSVFKDQVLSTFKGCHCTTCQRPRFRLTG